MSLSKTKFSAGDEVLASDMNEIIEGLIDSGYIKTDALTDAEFLALFDLTSRNACITTGENAVGWVVYYDQANNKVKYAATLPSEIENNAILGIVYEVKANEVRAMAPFSPVVDKAHENSNNLTCFSACYASAVGAYDKTDGHQVGHTETRQQSLDDADAMRFVPWSSNPEGAYANQVGTYIEVEYDSQAQDWYVSEQTLSKTTTGYTVSDSRVYVNGNDSKVECTEDGDNIVIAKKLLKDNQTWFNPVILKVMMWHYGENALQVTVSDDKATITKAKEVLVYNATGEIMPESELANYDTILASSNSSAAAADENDAEFTAAFGNLSIKARTKAMAGMSNFEAAEACYNYTPKASLINLRGQYYLPSLYMLRRLNANKIALKTAAMKNKVKMSWQYCWSCLEYSSSYAWSYSISGDNSGNNDKYSTRSIVAVLSC